MKAEDGLTTMTDAQLEALMARAAQQGAQEALRRIGLGDEHAGRDVSELRDLLTVWRDTKRTAWGQVVKAFVTLFLMALVAGAFVLASNYGGKQ